MPSTELPTGRYLSCPIDLSPDAGGQTRAMLMRNRIFVTEVPNNFAYRTLMADPQAA